MNSRRPPWRALLVVGVTGLAGVLPFASGSTEGSEGTHFRLTAGNVAADSAAVIVPHATAGDGECIDLGDISTDVGTRFGDGSEGGYVELQINKSLVLVLEASTDKDVSEVEAIITLLDGPAAGTTFRRPLIKPPQFTWYGEPTLVVDGIAQSTKMNIKFCLKRGVPPPTAGVTLVGGNTIHIDVPASIPPDTVVTGDLLLVPSGADRILNGAQSLILSINDGNPVETALSGTLGPQEEFANAIATWAAHNRLTNPLVGLVGVTDTGENSNTVTLSVTSPVHLNQPILHFGTASVPVAEHFNPYVQTFLRLNKVPDALANPESLSLTGGGDATARKPIDYLLVDPLWQWDAEGNPFFVIRACNPLEQTVLIDNAVDIPLFDEDEFGGLFSGHVEGSVPGGRCTHLSVVDSVIAFYNGHVPDDFQVPSNATAADIAEIVNRTGARPANLR